MRLVNNRSAAARRDWARLGVLAGALTLGVTAIAAAQEGWSPTPETVSAIGNSVPATAFSKVAVDPEGNAIVVFARGVPGGSSVVEKTRYDASTKSWSSPTNLGPSSPFEFNPQIAVDAGGNAIVVWEAYTAGVGPSVISSRYNRLTNSWSAPFLHAGPISATPHVAMNAGGDAIVVWSQTGGPDFGSKASRFSAVTGTWTAAATIVTSGTALDVAIDNAGNGHAVWLSWSPFSSLVRSARFDAAAATWGAAVTLSQPIPGSGVPAPYVAVNGAGDAVAAWSRGAVEAVRYPSGGSGWSAPAEVSTPPSYVDGNVTRVTVDAAGNAFVAWAAGAAPGGVHVSRFDVNAGTWSTPAALSDGSTHGPPAIASDAAGNAFVVWSADRHNGAARLRAARYSAGSSAWHTVSDLSAAGQVAADPRVAVNSAGSAVATWSQTLGSLYAVQALRWTPTPAVPTLGAVTPSAGTLSVAFVSPASSDPSLATTNYEYSPDGGATWTARSPAGAASPLVLSGLTDGISYSLRVRAVNAAGPGQPTSPAEVRSGLDRGLTDLRIVSRSGNRTTFAWAGPTAGLMPTGYLIEGGLAGQPAILASVPTGGTATQVTLDVPNGVFFVRVVAMTGGIRLGQSADLQFAVNVGAFPSAAINLLGSAAGQRLALSWVNTWNGAAPTGLRLDVSGSIATAIDLPVTEQFTFDGVPSGTYTFAVTPLINSVPGDASNVVTLTFPGTCSGPPGTPTAFSASTQAGRVYLDWLPPTSGAAVTHYAVHAAGAFTGSFPLTARTFSTPVPPGSYTVSIAAVGPCGTSAATAAQTVVVP